MGLLTYELNLQNVTHCMNLDQIEIWFLPWHKCPLECVYCFKNHNPANKKWYAWNIKCSLSLKGSTCITEQCSNVAKHAFEERYPPLLVLDTRNPINSDFALIMSNHLSNSKSNLLEFVKAITISCMMSMSVLNTLKLDWCNMSTWIARYEFPHSIVPSLNPHNAHWHRKQIQTKCKSTKVL